MTQFLKYFVIDVFTNERFKGNPLSVVLTNDDLSPSAYVNIAKEFGYSETSFVQYMEESQTVKVRSFTPTGFEINGAGHNLLGAVHAVLFNEKHFNPKGLPEILMRGKCVPISVDNQRINMMQQLALIKNEIPNKLISEAIFVKESGLSLGNLRPTVVKTEVAHLMVPITNIEILKLIKPNKDLLNDLANQYGFQGVYCFTFSDHTSDFVVKTRFFNPGIGIDEDPATGSAAGPLAGFLYHHGYLKKNVDYQFLQGEELNRPSFINCRIEDIGVLIGGTCVITMEGNIYF